MTREMTILVAEDDENDILLLQQALRKNNISMPVQVCRDGEEVVHYLSRIPPYEDPERYPFPGVLFLDIKLPKRSGLEVLAWLRSHPQFRSIPVMVLTSSQLDYDISEAYELGANAYMVKPAGFEELKNMLKVACDFWSLCEKPQPVQVKLSKEHVPQSVS